MQSNPRLSHPEIAHSDSFGSAALRAWDRFWFTPADPTILALIRIFCGVIVFYGLLAYTADLQELMGKHAWQDLAARQESYRLGETEKASLTSWEPTDDAWLGRPVWSIWFHVTDPTAMLAVHLFFVIVSLFFLIGLATRVTTAVTWFAVLSYIHRAPAVLFGMDTMVAIVLLYLMIAPAGGVLSVDRWLSRRRDKHGSAAVEGSVSGNVALRLLQIHVCIIYLSAGLSKLQGPAWWMGNAVWGALANPEFAPMHNELYLSMLRLLGSNRLVFEVAMTLATFGTLFFEISYPYLIWRPSTRRLILIFALFMHGFVGLFIGLKTFSMMMLAMNLAFVSPAAANRFLYKLSRGRIGNVESPEPPAMSEAVKVLKPQAVRQEKQHRAVASTHVQRKG